MFQDIQDHVGAHIKGRWLWNERICMKLIWFAEAFCKNGMQMASPGPFLPPRKLKFTQWQLRKTDMWNKAEHYSHEGKPLLFLTQHPHQPHDCLGTNSLLLPNTDAYINSTNITEKIIHPKYFYMCIMYISSYF